MSCNYYSALAVVKEGIEEDVPQWHKAGMSDGLPHSGLQKFKRNPPFQPGGMELFNAVRRILPTAFFGKLSANSILCGIL